MREKWWRLARLKRPGNQRQTNGDGRRGTAEETYGSRVRGRVGIMVVHEVNGVASDQKTETARTILHVNQNRVSAELKASNQPYVRNRAMPPARSAPRVAPHPIPIVGV